MIELIETWIESNKCEGKPAQFKARIQEENDPEFYYRQTVDGVKYGALGVYERDELWYVIHARSGRSLGAPFATMPEALRLVFLLRNLTKWSKVNWKNDRTYEADEFFWLCMLANDYCSDLDGDYEPLVVAISPENVADPVFLPENMVEIEEVEFGVTVTS